MAQSFPLLRRPLYVYDLPNEIVSGLRLKDQAPLATESETVTEHVPKAEDALAEARVSTAAASCALCGVTFKDALEQRRHAKSDFHHYNLKQRMKGVQTVNEAQFEALLQDLAESISGSDTSESDDDGGDEPRRGDLREDHLAALLKRQAKISTHVESQDDESPKPKRRRTGGTPLLWLTSSVLPSNISLGVYRALFTNSELEDRPSVPEFIRKKQLSSQAASKPKADSSDGVPPATLVDAPHFFLCMIGGGHFAAMVVSLAPKISKKAGGIEERHATVIAHKTFHRYTTRRKQGGAQSASDASKGAAHSAGSSLRRHNEAALTNEVRELLSEWKPMIASAQLLFVRASGTTNRRILYGPYEGQVLGSNDPRTRPFPFNTRRATQAELMRAFVELTRVKVSEVDEAALAAAAAAEAARTAAAATQPPAGKPRNAIATPKLSDEEAAAQLHTSQLQSLIRRSKAPAVLSYLNKNSISADFRFFPADGLQHHHAPTPLHLSASTNSSSVVLALLTKASADPKIVNREGRTAFDVAGDRATRDAFRVARHALGEARWDWTAAHVPAAMSKDEADRRDERDRKERDKKEDERRKAELERLKKEEDDKGREAEAQGKQKHGRSGGKALGVGAKALEKTPQERREEESRGLTPEARMRIERERRARAAEERIRRMQGQ